MDAARDRGARRGDRRALAAAWALAAVFLAAALAGTRGTPFLPPDVAYSLDVARNLVRGDGYTISSIQFHLGTFESVRHVPEMHGLLRPLEFAGLFELLGVDASVARIPGLVGLALSGVLVFALARRLLGDGPALLACVLTLGSPELFRYARLGVDDAGFAFFFLGLANWLHRGLVGGRARDFAVAGVFAGLAVLVKPIGFFLPVVFAAVALRVRRDGPRRVAALAACLLAPFALGVGAYLARNLLVSGSPGFRLTPLDWIWKVEGYEGAQALFPKTLSSFETLRAIGARRIVEIQAEQLAHFAGWLSPLRLPSAWDPLGPIRQRSALSALLPTLGILGTLVAFRRGREFPVLFGLAFGGGVLFVCLSYHFEDRYLAFLLPLFAIAAAGLAGISRGREGAAAPARRALGAAAAVLLTAAALVQLGGLARSLRQAPALDPLDLRASCGGSLTWLATHTDEDDRVLAFLPSLVTWWADRETVRIPSGGVDPIVEVARRYDTRWLLAHRAPMRPQTDRVLRRLLAEPGPLWAEPAFAESTCAVYRLAFAAPAGAGQNASQSPVTMSASPNSAAGTAHPSG